MRSLSVWWAVAISGLVACLAGCSSLDRDYESIQIGQPLPTDLPANTHRSASGLSMALDREGIWESAELVRVLACADGAVMAKEHLREETKNAVLLLVTTTEARCVIESQIPADALRAPAEGWKLDNRYQQVADRLLAMQIIRRGLTPSSFGMEGHDTVTADVAASLGEVKSAEDAFDLVGRELREAGLMPDPASVNVAEYLARTSLAIQLVPVEYPDRVFIDIDLAREPWGLALAELLSRPEAFAGVQDEQWHWKGCSASGEVRFDVRKTSPSSVKVEMSAGSMTTVAQQLWSYFFGGW